MDKLALARRHVADGLRIVARQQGIVDRFEAAGLDATSAQEALAGFERSQLIFEDDLAALLKREVLSKNRTRTATMRREYRGRPRNNNRSFPYEPLVMGRRVVMPAELQRVHRAVLSGDKITEDMRAVVHERWPELVAKLPPPRSG
jgi:hypothetical protein